MKYDFTTVPSRTDGTSSKWNMMKSIRPDVSKDVVPLSVADMEFLNAPEIIQGMKDYLDTHVLGYSCANDEYYDAVVSWMKRKHDYEIKKEWIVETSGVVPGFTAAIEAFTKPGEGVLLLTPVYYPMKRAILAKERTVVESPLLLSEDGYEIDFDDFEQKSADTNVTMLLFCSPHNPVGRVWKKEELERLVDICLKNHVFILSDEIHNDLIMPGYQHTVLATLSKEASMNCAVCTAPSKTFSLAGLQTSNIIIENPEYRKAFQDILASNSHFSLNALGYVACKFAYNNCEEWLSQCIDVIHTNAKYIEHFMKEHFPSCKVYPLEGTYLLWVDFRSLGLSNEELEHFMQFEAGIFADEGYIFGEAGSGFERFNLACPTSVIVATFDRLYQAYIRCKNNWK